MKKKRGARVIKSDVSYWEFLSSKQNNREDGQLQEDAYANGDVLAAPSDPADSLQLEAIQEAFELLSPQQKKVIDLYGYEGKTLEETGIALKLSRSTVYTLYRRAVKKIERIYKRLKEENEND